MTSFLDILFQNPRTEEDVIAKLYNKEDTLTTMLIMHILSQKDTNHLGFFEIQFLYEPKAVQAVKRYTFIIGKPQFGLSLELLSGYCPKWG